MIAGGIQAEAVTSELASRLGLAGGQSTPNGTLALILALKLIAPEPGCEIILPTYVCPSVWHAVVASGMQPVLCDVEPDDWCMSERTVARCVTPNTGGILVVHPFGITAPVDMLQSFGVPVLEDCCQAFGHSHVPTGITGLCAVYSFHATKLLAAGEGGMVLSRDERILDRLRTPSATHDAFRKPMSDLQAALLGEQLKRYDSFLERRFAIANRYYNELSGLECTLPESIKDRSVFFRFPLRTNLDFESVKVAFATKGIHVRRGVDSLLHREFSIHTQSFQQSERCYRETVSIPIYPAMTDNEVDQVIQACRSIFRHDCKGRG